MKSEDLDKFMAEIEDPYSIAIAKSEPKKNENCQANQHEYEYVDDSFSDGFYSSSGGHYQCLNCGDKASIKEIDSN